MFIILVLGWAFQIWGIEKQLVRTDVRMTMREMFSYHVENKELSPEIVRRTLKIYIEQFDSQKLYLTQEEVNAYLNPSYALISRIIDCYFSDDISVFETINQIFTSAIHRSRQYREGMLSRLAEGGQPMPAPDLQKYAETPAQLEARMEQYLASRLKPNMDVKKKQAAFIMWQRRVERFEKGYLGGDVHHITMHALKAMAKSLDAHTGYYSPQEAAEIRSSLQKEFEGVGVVFREEIDGVYVGGVVQGSPAERSSVIEAGDLLIAIDEYEVTALPYDEVLDRLKGKVGSTVKLKFQRGEKVIIVDLKREKIALNDERLTVSFDRVAGGVIGKLSIPAFYDNGRNISLDNDLREALRFLEKNGPIRGLILDLRENTGGFLTQAVKVAGMFIPNGLIVISKYSNGETRYTRDIDGRKTYEGPLLVLTSKLSASASEIVAGALQDYGAALIIGDSRTFGKGSMQYQTITDDKAKAFYKVTVGRYYTASGRSPQIEGVKADIVIPSEIANVNIGERFLKYPLSGDQLDQVTPGGQGGFRSFENPVPYLKMRESPYRKMLGKLIKNSQERLSKDPDFQIFLQSIEGKASSPKRGENWGVADLQLKEAVKIIQDMLFLANNP
ncbi:MAG: PDZ domain-containing protein [Simkaniaceae bacterium]|nr:PDZ domain-containing protein [Simkaniaceae bacterium]